jgi:hypothetical protein
MRLLLTFQSARVTNMFEPTIISNLSIKFLYVHHSHYCFHVMIHIYRWIEKLELKQSYISTFKKYRMDKLKRDWCNVSQLDIRTSIYKQRWEQNFEVHMNKSLSKV